jgi:hypothetical protein
MAEFSKQYIQNYMPEFEEWDFDIEEEFDNIQPGEYMPLICEGFGFVGIEKQLDGSKFFLYRNNKDNIVSVPYQLADENTYKNILSED